MIHPASAKAAKSVKSGSRLAGPTEVHIGKLSAISRMIWEGEKDTIPLHCRPCTATGDGRANDVILTSAHTLQQVYGKTSLRTTDTSAYEETDEHHYWVCDHARSPALGTRRRTHPFDTVQASGRSIKLSHNESYNAVCAAHIEAASRRE